MSLFLKPQTNGTTKPTGVNDNGSRFPGNSITLQTRFIIDKLLANLEDKQAIEKLYLVRVHSLPQRIRTVAKNGQCDQVYHLENCLTKIEIVRLPESIKDTFKMFPHISTNGIYVVYICSVICSKNDLSNS